MRLRPVAAILLRQWYLLRGSPVRVLPMFAWVAIDIVLWGFITRYLNAVSGAGINFTAVLLGAVLLWDLFGRVMQGVTTAFLEDVWSRNFLNLFASPLTISEYVAGLVIASIASSVIGLTVMLALAMPVFGLSFLALGVHLLLFLCVLYGFGVALGVLASAMVLRLGPASDGSSGRYRRCCPRSAPCSIRCRCCRDGCAPWHTCCRLPTCSRGCERCSPDGRSTRPGCCGGWRSQRSRFSSPATASSPCTVRRFAPVCWPATAPRR